MDIERQRYLLSRFDTFLCLPLFGPSLTIRRRCLKEDCIEEYQ